MLLLNYSHPLPPSHYSGLPVEVRAIPTEFDHARSFVEQPRELANAARLSPEAWPSEGMMVNLAALNFRSAALLAESDGRVWGVFPPVVRLRPAAEALAARYEVAEVLDLQAARHAGRTRRS